METVSAPRYIDIEWEFSKKMAEMDWPRQRKSKFAEGENRDKCGKDYVDPRKNTVFKRQCKQQ